MGLGSLRRLVHFLDVGGAGVVRLIESALVGPLD